jgi:CelD/BcsL family acetyltransferase involved in cellulose biosynthesis
MKDCNTVEKGMGIELAVLRDVTEWDRIEEEWNELFLASPSASPPLHFDWLRQWWRVYGGVYGQEGRGLRVIIVRRGEHLIGAMPLYQSLRGPVVRTRRLEFLSTGEREFEEICPDYMDLLYRPGEADLCLDAIAGWLLGDGRGDWDEVLLRDVSEESPLAGWWAGAEDGCRRKTAGRGMCPIANIAGGLDAYWGRLSANMRQHSRRLLRLARGAGAELTVAAGPAAADVFFEDMVRLHQERWRAAGKAGCFAAARFTEFHRTLCRSWAPQGRAVLARLGTGDRPLAVIYGFVIGRKFDFYQSGVVHETGGAVQSPGTVALLLLMDHLAQRGIELFDFLRGESFYKQRLATQARLLVEIRLFRPGVRLGVRAASSFIQRAAGKGRRMLRAAYTGQPAGR